MKKLLIAIIIFFSTPLFASEPIDLSVMKASGMSTENIGRFLAQNLNSTRTASPIDANFLIKLSKYGGDDLVTTYLDLDQLAANSDNNFFLPDKISGLIDNNMEAAELKKLLSSEKDKLETINAHYAKEFTIVNNFNSAKVGNGSQTEKTSKLEPPMQARVMDQQQSRSAANEPIQPAKSPRERPTQSLRPGQAADPASNLPPPESTYDIRRPRTDGPWLGVTEKELPDGHAVEVNVSGDSRVTGQEVISRPSGHKIYRYYSGKPDTPYSGADPEQEKRNQKELETIFQRNK